jgi:D-xylose transport system substrate-binding protein
MFGLGAATVLAAGLIMSGVAMAQSPSAAAPGTGPIIGVSWNNYNEERWLNSDEPAMRDAILAAGGQYISRDAKSSAETQLNDIDTLITDGAQVLVILAQDQTAILPAIQRAAEEGIPVIAYDRIIQDPSVLYMTFDNVGVGRAMAEVIFGLVPEGNYAIIKGNEPDENTRFLRAGMDEVIGDAWAPGDPGTHDPITIVCETYTDNWDPATARTNMENCLTAVGNQVDAVLAENDGMAGGVIGALEAQGLSIPVSGQDGDNAALNRVAQGRQAVSVWKDSRILGKAAGEAAIALAGGTPKEEIPNVVDFVSPNGTTLTSVFAELDVLTQENLQEAVDRGKITQEALCADVEAGSVPACP